MKYQVKTTCTVKGVCYEPGALIDVPEHKVDQLLSADKIAIPGQEEVVEATVEVEPEVEPDGNEL